MFVSTRLLKAANLFICFSIAVGSTNVSPIKSTFCHATLLEAKVKAISDFPAPTCKLQLMRFLGMAGYYREFCDNFCVIAEPLTNLLTNGQSSLGLEGI